MLVAFQDGRPDDIQGILLIFRIDESHFVEIFLILADQFPVSIGVSTDRLSGKFYSYIVFVHVKPPLSVFEHSRKARSRIASEMCFDDNRLYLLDTFQRSLVTIISDFL